MRNDIAWRPAQHVADFVKAHREGAFQRRDAVRTVLAKRRVDLHEQVEERRRNLLQRSEETTIQQTCTATHCEEPELTTSVLRSAISQ